jgi:hypothetical protein
MTAHLDFKAVASERDCISESAGDKKLKSTGVAGGCSAATVQAERVCVWYLDPMPGLLVILLVILSWVLALEVAGRTPILAVGCE